MKTLIKNGRIVTAVDDYNADILDRRRTRYDHRQPSSIWKPTT